MNRYSTDYYRTDEELAREEADFYWHTHKNFGIDAASERFRNPPSLPKEPAQNAVAQINLQK